MSISFKQSTYSVSENEGLVEIVLVVNLIRTDITVQVRSSDNTATGEHLKSISIIMLVMVLQEVLIIVLDHTM